MHCPIYNGTLETFISSKMWKKTVFYWLETCLLTRDVFTDSRRVYWLETCLLTRDVFTDSRRVYWLETCFFLWISLLHLISKKWEKPRLNNKPFKERNKNIGILHSWSVKAFNGIIIVNRPWWVTSNYAYSPLGKSEINKSHWLEKSYIFY